MASGIRGIRGGGSVRVSPTKVAAGKRNSLASYGTALAVLGIPVIAAAFEADSVEEGRPVRQSDWALPFAWEAPAAVATRADESGGRCLIYLGNASGFVALYDPADGSSLRLPTSGTTVRTGGLLTDAANVPRAVRRPPARPLRALAPWPVQSAACYGRTGSSPSACRCSGSAR